MNGRWDRYQYRPLNEDLDSSATADTRPPSDQRPAEEEDDGLQDSLLGLSRLSSYGMGLEQLLTLVAGYAVRAIPGADGAGLTLLEEDRPDTVVVTDEFVREVDNIQYGIGQGPCITAAREGQTVLSGSLGGDSRWPYFGRLVARLGVHSVVSLPLISADGVVGAMNVYARERYAFDDRAAELGEIYAGPAAVAVQNAYVLAQTQRLAARLQDAMATRAVIERAVGIILSRSGGTEADALNLLRSLSQHEHLKLSQVAQQIVDEAVSRADARRRRRLTRAAGYIEGGNVQVES